MLISHDLKLVILSPWKCATSTIHATLAEYNQSPYDRFFHFNAILNKVVHQHITLADFLNLPESRLGYSEAVFIRNPYDRAYSGFLQVQRDFSDQPKAHYPQNWIADLVKSQIASNMDLVIKSGFDFDEWIKIIPEYEIRDTGKNTNFPLHPLHYWTHHKGKRVVSHLGRVESFDTDFDDFCALIGIARPQLKIENTTDRQRMSAGYRYTSRMSRRTLDKINDLFFDDFEIFGYNRM